MELSRHIIEAPGPEGLLDSTLELLGNDQLDMLVVRGLLVPENPLLAALDNGDRSLDRENSAQLTKEIPQLLGVRDLIADMWQEHGYSNMSVTPGFYLDQWRKPGMLPHLDESVYSGNYIEAGLQISLCVSGARTFMAQRLAETFALEDGSFDHDGYDAFVRSERWFEREPRSSATLYPGDAAVFAHHPAVTLHGVKLEQPSVARLISYNAVAATED